ncbi:MAG TPA: tetratricopeptide repeat protein [Planctomycetaceae bacterium]|jgi:tetratricopeptide (TPR) repeat protein|nr:tetratricopeptide repeat protein [Planctomycetaceae bacterium]
MRWIHRSTFVRCVLGMTVVSCFGRALADTPAEPHFQGLGTHTRKITTHSPEAQKYFDQGLAFLFGFNHDEAIRSFEAAAASDPDCAMAFWGIAIANGPHINYPTVDEAHAKAAWRALRKARDRSIHAAGVEQALIDALGRRYADPEPDDRKPLDEAYAAAMRKVWQAFPDDADVGALTAEALMDLRPWDQWTLAGNAQPGTDEVLRTLDAVLAKSPRHPLALHLLIHAVEASPHPERADAAAERLRDLEPGIGHLVHMPSHVDVRRGRWQDAVVANEKAIAADKAYRAIVPHQGLYRFYMAHNHQMLAYAAMMQGESLKATHAIQELLASVPQEFLKDNAAMVDGFFAMPYELHLRFGRWDQMLAEPKPSDVFPITTALWHYARGVAFAAKGKVDAAKSEQQAFLASAKALPEWAAFGKNSGSDLLGIAEKMLEGEILYRQGQTDASIAALREAVRREDQLHYMEPPDWIQPVRHALGATLMDAKRYADAEAVYRDDLTHYPENGWSLYGLSRSLRRQGKTDEALTVSMRFDKVWKRADVKLSSSCFCMQGKE